MAASPPEVVTMPPVPHSVVVPGTSARSPTPTPDPRAAGICVRVQSPSRDRCRIQVGELFPAVTTGIQTPPPPSVANRSACCTGHGDMNRRQHLPFQCASTRCPFALFTGVVPDTQTLCRETARTSLSWLLVRAASAAGTLANEVPL